jgi:hypothetical protein
MSSPLLTTSSEKQAIFEDFRRNKPHEVLHEVQHPEKGLYLDKTKHQDCLQTKRERIKEDTDATNQQEKTIDKLNCGHKYTALVCH